MTLGENMADNGGLQRAFEAWKIQLDDPASFASQSLNLKGLQNYTDDQLFFLSFAQVWCHVPDTSPTGQDYKKLELDVHSPDRYRVNGVVSNSAQFAKTWQCRVGQNMNPTKKCVIW
jgi:predicted metalloendopeptidase